MSSPSGLSIHILFLFPDQNRGIPNPGIYSATLLPKKFLPQALEGNLPRCARVLSFPNVVPKRLPACLFVP